MTSDRKLKAFIEGSKGRNEADQLLFLKPPVCDIPAMIDSGLVGSTEFHSGGVPREQKMLEGHLHRVIYHQVY